MKTTIPAMILALMIGPLTGCEPDGPAEEFGESVDEAVEDTGEAIEDAGEGVAEACEDLTNEDCN